MVGSKIKRSKSQAYYRYFPWAVYLQDEIYVMTDEWKTYQVEGIDKQIIFNTVKLMANQFGSHDPMPRTASGIDIRDLKRVDSKIFPRTFRCSRCGRMAGLQNEGQIEASFEKLREKCRLDGHDFWPIQFRFVTIHSCGFIGEAFDPSRDRCKKHPGAFLKLNTHNSERLSSFRLDCEVQGCRTSLSIVPIWHACSWSNEGQANGQNHGKKGASVQLLTKNLVSFPELFTNVNLKDERRSDIKGISGWEKAVYGLLCKSESFVYQDLTSELQRESKDTHNPEDIVKDIHGINSEASKKILEIIRESYPLNHRDVDVPGSNANRILDFLLAANQPPYGIAKSLISTMERDSESSKLKDYIGIRDIVSVGEINLTKILYGYSRADYLRLNRKLNFFLPKYGTDIPGNGIEVYASPINTEGLIVILDPNRLIDYADQDSPFSKNSGSKNREGAYEIICEEFFRNDYPKSYNVDYSGSRSDKIFRVLHTLSHLFIRAIGRISGVEETSLAEMLFPEAAAFLIYVNKDEDFNLGTISSNVEDKLEKLLDIVTNFGLDCLYDPICSQDSNGSCPACLQIAEISCVNFNRFLSRKDLIGDGNKSGYWKE
jgi:hypothetical protein